MLKRIIYLFLLLSVLSTTAQANILKTYTLLVRTHSRLPVHIKIRIKVWRGLLLKM